MKEFTIGGKSRHQRTFAEVLGMEINLYDKNGAYLYAGGDEDEIKDRMFDQCGRPSEVHFTLPAQWDEAMSYARAFYGMEKEEKPIEEQLSKMLGEDNARLRKAGCDMAEAAIRVMNKYDGVHRLSLAVSEWTKAIADEGGRGKNPEQPKEEKPPKRQYALLTLDGYWDSNTSEERVEIVARAFEMIKAQDKYIQLLTDELDSAVGVATMIGWRSKRADEGEKMRKKIQAITAGRSEEKPPLPESESDLPPIELVAVAVPEVASKEFWAFTKLYQLRQAYWNAHEQGWRPDWTEGGEDKWCIKFNSCRPGIWEKIHTEHFLAFPTMEQAQHFLKHHIGLIEQARELL